MHYYKIFPFLFLSLFALIFLICWGKFNGVINYKGFRISQGQLVISIMSIMNTSILKHKIGTDFSEFVADRRAKCQPLFWVFV